MLRRSLIALLLLVGGFAESRVLAAPGVQLTIRDGRVWLNAERATVGQILAEWARVGGTQIVNGERLPAGPQTLLLNGVTEQEALDVLLRSAGGFVAVAKTELAEDAPTGSQFKRIVVASGAQSASLGTRPASAGPGMAAPMFAPQPAPAEPTIAVPGVGERIIGPDGQPVPDDQDEDVPQPVNGSIPPGFSPQPEAPPAATPTMPQGVPTPGMMPPPPATPPEPGAPVPRPRRPGGINER